MKCNPYALLGVLASLLSLSCQESLPTYVAPTNVLALRVSSVEQLNDHLAPPGRQAVHIVIVGENIHDEVFQDTVDIRGSIRIWWKRKPGRYKTIYLSEKSLTDRSLVHNRKMLLVPGQQFSMDAVWNLRSDDGIYLPSEMDFLKLRQRYCDPNVRCATPEVFVIEVSLNVYDRLGYIAAEPLEFTFIGRTCDVGGYPPCN
jgi:predicted component of type VI protein secretion system